LEQKKNEEMERKAAEAVAELERKKNESIAENQAKFRLSAIKTFAETRKS